MPTATSRPFLIPLFSLAVVLGGCPGPLGDLGDFTASATTGGPGTGDATLTATASSAGASTSGTTDQTTGTASTTGATTSSGADGDPDEGTSTGPVPPTTETTTETTAAETTAAETTAAETTAVDTTGAVSSSSTGDESTDTGVGETTGGSDYPACGDFGDPHTILDATIEGDTLHLLLKYSGGCQEHLFELCWGGIVLDVGDIVVGVVHDAQGDDCKSEIEDPRSFDLTPLKK